MDQVCIHATLSDKNDHFSDNMKKTMLMNAFGPLKQLQHVQDEDMQHIARHERPLTYMEYAEILQAASVSHNRQEKPQGATNQMKRSVYHLAINDVKDYHECFPYGIDSQLDAIQANASEHQKYNPAASMPKHKWIRLSKPNQDTWDTLSEDTKVIIIEKKSLPEIGV